MIMKIGNKFVGFIGVAIVLYIVGTLLGSIGIKMYDIMLETHWYETFYVLLFSLAFYVSACVLVVVLIGYYIVNKVRRV